MSATRAFALRSTLRAACNRPIQSQVRLELGKRGYASGHGGAHGARKAGLGGDLPWLATSLALSVPTLGYLLFSGTEEKSHAVHRAEAEDEHGVKTAKPKEEIGEGHEPIPTSHTDTGDAESKGHVVGYKPEGVHGGHEDSDEDATPQDNVAIDKAKDNGHESDKNATETAGMSSDGNIAGRSSGKSSEGAKNTEKGVRKRSDDSPVDGSGKPRDKASTDESNEGHGGSALGGKTGEMDDSQESQEKKLTDKEPSKRVDPTKK